MSNTVFNSHVNYMLKTVGISSADSNQQMECLELTESDLAVLKELQPVLQPAHYELMQHFHEDLLSFPHISHFLNNGQTLNSQKHKQAEHLTNLLRSQYNWDYILNRPRTEISPTGISLKPHWYFGAYSKYLCKLLPDIWATSRQNTELTISGLQTLLKIVFFDIELAIKTYIPTEQNNITSLTKFTDDLICTTPSAQVLLNSELTVQSINPFMARKTITNYEIPKGHLIDQLFQNNQLRDRANDILAGLRKQHSMMILSKDINGKKRYFEFSIIPMLSTNNKQQLKTDSKLLIIIEDLTEQETFRSQVTKADQRVQAIMDNVTDGIITIDEKGIIESYNTAAERLFQYKDNEVIGQNIKMLMPEPYKSQHDGYLAHYHNSGKHLNERLGLKELTGQRKDTTCFPMELSVSEMTLGNEHYYIGMIHDITLRKNAEHEKAKLSHAIEQTADSIMITDKNGIIEYVNTGFEETTGYSRQEVIGKTPSIIKSGEMNKEFYSKFWKTIKQDKVFRNVFINKRKDGSLYYEEKTISPMRNDDSGITHYISSGKDITDHMHTHERLQYLAHHDILTGLPNRLLFTDRLAQAIKNGSRSGGQVALIYLDIDRFKNINDTLGHMAGDSLLRIISKRLQTILRDNDTTARLSGDEFTILLTDILDTSFIPSIANKILFEISRPINIDTHELFITASLGIAICPDDSSDPQTLLKYSDTAMYHAKQNGRNGYQFYTPNINVMAKEQLLLENQLHRALERNEFKVYFQPQYNIKTNKLCGIEALLRWNHPIHGLLPPIKFIKLLEDTGLIIPVGDWVLTTACARFSHWLKNGFDIPKLAVNVSPKQFSNKNLINHVNKTLQDTHLPAHKLELEITESILIEERDTHINTILNLHKSGVGIAMDDFGTGYSSLSYLRQFPIRTLKIDKSFIKQLPENHDDCVLARTIIAMGQNLSLNIIAEGVENHEQLKFLKQLGCTAAQGYLYSPALPHELFTNDFINSKVQ